MGAQLEKLLQEALADLENLSPEKVQSLMQEALKLFAALKEKGASSNPEDRGEAAQIALSLKEALQAQAEQIGKEAGIDPERFSSLAEDQELFTASTWTELNSAKAELEGFQNRLKEKVKKTSPSLKKNKTTWLPG